MKAFLDATSGRTVTYDKANAIVIQKQSQKFEREKIKTGTKYAKEAFARESNGEKFEKAAIDGTSKLVDMDKDEMNELLDQAIVKVDNNEKLNDEDFSIFALMIMLSELQSKQWRNLDKLANDIQITFVATFDKKSEKIIEKAKHLYSAKMIQAVFSIVGSVAGVVAAARGAATAPMMASFYGNTISSLVGQTGGIFSAGKEQKAAGVEAEMAKTVEKKQSELGFNKDRLLNIRSDAQQRIDSFMQSGGQLMESEYSLIKFIASQ